MGLSEFKEWLINEDQKPQTAALSFWEKALLLFSPSSVRKEALENQTHSRLCSCVRTYREPSWASYVHGIIVHVCEEHAKQFGIHAGPCFSDEFGLDNPPDAYPQLIERCAPLGIDCSRIPEAHF